MKLRTNRIFDLSLARTLGAFFFLIGLALSGLSRLGAFTGSKLAFTTWFGFDPAMHSPLLMLLLYPFFAGVAGYLSGLLISGIYNFISRHT